MTSNAEAPEAAVKEFVAEVSRALAKTLGKPEAYCMVGYTRAERMLFGGSPEPCAFIALSSIGALGADRNAQVSQALTAACTTHLGVEGARVYVNFTDVKHYNWGHNGGTF